MPPDPDRRQELDETIEEVGDRRRRCVREAVDREFFGEATTLPNPYEIATVAGFAKELPVKGDTWDLSWRTSLSCAPGDPWLHIGFEPVMPYVADVKGVAPIVLVLWRFSLDVYEQGADGAVGEDPIRPARFAERFR